MNAVEIEEAISALAEQPFIGGEFPFAFLQAFSNKETTIKKLRAGASNSSDLGGVLQRSHIHMAVCAPGMVTKTLVALKASPATAKAKARFILATDGTDFEAEDFDTGETVAWQGVAADAMRTAVRHSAGGLRRTASLHEDAADALEHHAHRVGVVRDAIDDAAHALAHALGALV